MKINKVTYCLIAVLPLLALVSASLVRVRGDYTLTLIIPCMATAMVFILVRDGVPKYAYPLGVFSIALSLIIHSEATLGSNYLYGGDIQTEYLWLNLAMEKGWQPAMGSNLATALSITVVWSGLSQLLHVDPIWLYKISATLLLSLIPLMLYFAYQGQIGSKRAFLATILLTAVLLNMPYGGFRVISGEFLLALCLLLMLTTRIRLAFRVVALIISSICLVFAYYAIGILYSCLLIAVCSLAPLLRFFNGRQFLMPLRYIAVVAVITIAAATLWYTFSGGGVVSLTAYRIGHEQVVQSLSQQPSPAQQQIPEQEPPTAQSVSHPREQAIDMAFGLDFGEASMQGKSFRITQYLIELFLVVGLLGAIVRFKAGRWSNELVAFGVGISFALLFCVVLPYFSGYWGADKFYRTSLLILSPFCIIGGETIFRYIPKLKGKAVLLTAVIIVIYFLFHNGVIFEATKFVDLNRYDSPSRMILSSYRVDNPNWKESEYVALQWFLDNTDGSQPIYGDAYALPLFSHLVIIHGGRGNLAPDTIVPQGAFVFLREYNTKTGELAYIERVGEWAHYKHGKVPYSSSWEVVYSVGDAIICVNK